jgi:hypothetical protein
MLTSTMSSTNPLQLINTPIVKLSLHTRPHSFAARVPPTIFPKKAKTIIPITYPHIIPLSSSAILVLSPESAKYRGKKSTVTRSSTFSVSFTANPLSCGQIKPIKKPPKIACTPIMSVKKAEARTMSSVRPTMD